MPPEALLSGALGCGVKGIILDGLTPDQVLLDHPLELFSRQMMIPNLVGIDHGKRPPLTYAEAVALAALDLLRPLMEPKNLNPVLKLLVDLGGHLRGAPRAGAYENMTLGRREGRFFLSHFIAFLSLKFPD